MNRLTPLVIIIVLSLFFKVGFGQSLSLSENEFDHGTIYEADTVSHTFSLTNTTSQVVIINSVIPNCSCLTTTLSSTSVNPGQSVTLQVDFDTTGKFGDQKKLISLFLNSNGTEERALLYVKGHIVPSD